MQWQPLGLPSYRGDSRAVFVVGQTEKLLHQVGDLFELNVKLRCQKVKLGEKKINTSVSSLLHKGYKIQLVHNITKCLSVQWYSVAGGGDNCGTAVRSLREGKCTN